MPGRTPLSKQATREASASGQFFVRWGFAVALSVVVGGLIEYGLIGNMLRDQFVEQLATSFASLALPVQDVLAADLPDGERQTALDSELERIARSPEVVRVAVYTADGELLAWTDGGSAGGAGGTAHVIEPLRKAIASQDVVVSSKLDPTRTDGASVNEFLFPLSFATSDWVLEVDLGNGAIERFKHEVRLRLVEILLLLIVIAIPLSYLFGGRTLNRRRRDTERAALIDPLTGIPGRRGFRPTLTSAIADSTQAPVGLALIDIDDFKHLNDRLGHSHGDRVLVALAKSFDALRASDSPFRVGGDEFVVVLPQADDVQAGQVVERVRSALSAAMPGVTLSIGVAAAMPGDDADQQEMWERVDSALYEAKRLGRNLTVHFSAIATSMTMTADKIEAVSALLEVESPVAMVFQPVWDLNVGRLLGHEVLLRLPAGCPISGPTEAFALAHRLGVAAALDARARRAALVAVASRDWHGLLFLNMHPDALRELDVDALVAEVAAAGLAPSDVVVEVTEHADLDNAEHIRVLKGLRASGFRLALDDMGRGNAGLRALTHVRFDIVKIDRDVIAHLGADDASAATIAAATTYVRRTGGWIIAEGIEDQAMLDAVLGEEPQPAPRAVMLAGQGFLLGRPAARPLAADAMLATRASGSDDVPG